MGRIDELERRIEELELTMLAHRANLRREDWRGDEEMLREVAAAIEEISGMLPAGHGDKMALAEYFAEVRDSALESFGDYGDYSRALRERMEVIAGRARRGELLVSEMVKVASSSGEEHDVQITRLRLED